MMPSAVSPAKQRLQSLDDGVVRLGPQTVHLDITNSCNTDCVTCWDHSPHLLAPPPSTITSGSSRLITEASARARREAWRSSVACAAASPAADACASRGPSSAWPVCARWSCASAGPLTRASMQPRWPQ